jgi:ABC-type transporter Mla maintaining outer membrane lipid asymmetry permease subunit MlaE
MFGKIIRAAAGFAGAMLVASVLAEVINPYVLPRLKENLGTDHILYTSLDGVTTWLPFIVLIALVLGLIARGIVESKLPGA